MSDREVGEPGAGPAPRTALLLLGVLSALAPPLAFQAFGEGVGSFSMFTRPERYRVRVIVTEPGGARRYLPLDELAPHLGRDARRVIVNASDWFVGETQMRLLAAGLADLGELACAVEPGARVVHVALERHSVQHADLGLEAAKVECHGRATAR